MLQRLVQTVSRSSQFAGIASRCSQMQLSFPFRSYSNRDENETPRTRFSMRRQKLPPFPQIETITDLELWRFLPANFKETTYGEHVFKEFQEGFVHIYFTGYKIPEPLHAASGFAVCYGWDHPLNIRGPTERKFSVHHSKLHAFLQALKSVPKDSLFKKVCFCVDDKGLIAFISKSLPAMSENAFRSVYTGRLNKDLETSMEINRLLRLRQDLTIKLQYLPSDLHFPDLWNVQKQARKAAEEAERERKNKSNEWPTYKDD